MHRFIKEILVFAVILAAIHVIIYCARPAGMMGGDYERFASPRASSLILGTSMAAIDVDPEMIAERLEATYTMPIYNFSFTINESPYGEIYNKAVFNKLQKNSDSCSLFILCVDPCNLGLTNADENGHANRENTEVLNQIHRMYSITGFHPEYFFRRVFLQRSFYKKPGNKDIQYTPHGRRNTQRVWGLDGEDSTQVQLRWETMNRPYYKETFSDYSLSEERMDALRSLVHVLKKRGDVYLVRLPVGIEFTEMQDSVCPEFEKVMNMFSIENHVRYISFKERYADFQTTDGVHLYGSEAIRLTEEICDSVCQR